LGKSFWENEVSETVQEVIWKPRDMEDISKKKRREGKYRGGGGGGNISLEAVSVPD